MDIERFNKSPIGRLEAIQVPDRERDVMQDYFAYVPDHLPNDLEIPNSTINRMTRAVHALGELDSFTQQLKNPQLLVRPLLRREALSTSALEGTYSPAEDVLAAEANPDAPRTQATTEILNYVRATESAILLLEDRPLCIPMISELQKTLVQHTPDEDYQIGKVRETLVMLGPYRGCPIEESTYIPPPPGEALLSGFRNWESWIHADDEIPTLVRIALGHYQFETLHPYTNGNGRIGRLIAILQLVQSRFLNYPVINLSPFFERDGGERYRYLLRKVSLEGAFTEWFNYFFDALRSQAVDAYERAADLLKFRDQAVVDLRSNGRSGKIIEVAEGLIEYPSMDVRFVKERYQLNSHQGAQKIVNQLVDDGLLTPRPGQQRNRVYQAPAVFDVLFR